MDRSNNIEKNRAFFNRWAKSYDAGLFQFWMRKFYLPILKEVMLIKKSRLLDISCGTGELLRNMQGKAQLYGVDISEEMLNKARMKLPKEVTLLKADVHHLSFENNYFDCVVTTEAFHHYYNQQLAFHEMSRVTKKGGKVIISDINFFLKPIHWLFQKIEPGCVKINSKKEMRRLFEKTGLKNIHQSRNFLFAVMTVGEK